MEQEQKYRRLHRSTAAERASIVERFRRSGLSRSNFARKHGFAISTLHRWLALAPRILQETQPPQFSEVKLLPSLPPLSWALEVVSPAGFTLRFRELPRIEELNRLLSGAAC